MFVTLLASFLYLADQMPLAILLLLATSLLKLISSRVKVCLSDFYLILAAILSYGYGVYSNDREILTGLVSVFHLITLICIFAVMRPLFDRNQFNTFTNWYIFLALTSYFVTLIVPIESMYYTEFSGSNRYKFLFHEPSFLALFSAFLLYLQVFKAGVKTMVSLLKTIFLTSLVFLTLSGSGLMMVAIIAFMYFSRQLTPKKMFFAFIAAFLGVVAVYFMVSEIAYINTRVELISSGSYGSSVTLRFIAPIQILMNVANDIPILGTGYGYHEGYILANKANFALLYANGQYSVNINNLWALLVFNFGFVGTAIVLPLILYKHFRQFKGKDFVFLFSFYMFIGTFASPIFFGGLYMLRQRLIK